MSSYFDNQYGGEDEDNKFNQDEDDDHSTSSSDSDNSDNESEHVDDNEDELDEFNDEIEDDIEDEDDIDLEDEMDDDELSVQYGGDEDGEEVEKKSSKRVKNVPSKTVYKKPIDFMDDDDDEDDDDDGEEYLQKFDQSVNDNYIVDFHPESILQNYDEILSMTKVIRDENGIIVDKLHRTIPFLTKYEKSRILGQRAKQINSGAYPFVKVPENVVDGYIIAEMELKQKRIPFIIRRPLPNGGSEYWKLQDLEDISF